MAGALAVFQQPVGTKSKTCAFCFAELVRKIWWGPVVGAGCGANA